MENSGIFFGYPKCCIDQFLHDCRTGIKFIDRKNRLKASKNGFVPCEHHAELINRKTITIHSLINNRKCSEPFIKIYVK